MTAEINSTLNSQSSSLDVLINCMLCFISNKQKVDFRTKFYPRLINSLSHNDYDYDEPKNEALIHL